MKAKVIKTGEIIEVKEWRGASDVIYSTPDMNMFYADNELEFLPDATEEVTIECYAVRWSDGDLTIFQNEPIIYRYETKGTEHISYGSQDGCKLFLTNDLLQSVTCENSPKKVRITITPIEE